MHNRETFQLATRLNLARRRSEFWCLWDVLGLFCSGRVKIRIRKRVFDFDDLFLFPFNYQVGTQKNSRLLRPVWGEEWSPMYGSRFSSLFLSSRYPWERLSTRLLLVIWDGCENTSSVPEIRRGQIILRRTSLILGDRCRIGSEILNLPSHSEILPGCYCCYFSLEVSAYLIHLWGICKSTDFEFQICKLVNVSSYRISNVMFKFPSIVDSFFFQILCILYEM